MKSLVLGLSLLTLVCSTGCATLFKPKLEPVTMQSTPGGAEVWVDGTFVGRSPVTLELKAGAKPVIVTFKKAGYEDQRVRLTSSVGVHWVVLDVMGGLAPIVIDAVTGDWYQFDKKLVSTTLQRRTHEDDEEVQEVSEAEVEEEEELAPPPPPRRKARTVRRAAAVD